jgi:ribosomal protein L24E
MDRTTKKLIRLFILFGFLSISRLVGQTDTVGDTLTFKVNGLVCSFCAHGLNKGIGKMDYTDNKSVFVDINNQIVKVVLNEKYKKIPSSVINQTIKVIEDSGYEVHKITYQNKVIIVRKEK